LETNQVEISTQLKLARCRTWVRQRRFRLTERILVTQNGTNSAKKRDK
jgi:hypothetical protein